MKPIGPLHMAGSTGAEPLSDPSGLSVSEPKTGEKPKAKAKKSGKKFQLPGWTKWAVIGAAVLIVIGSLLFTRVPEVDHNLQTIAQAIHVKLEIPLEEKLKDADYQRVTELNLSGRGLDDLTHLHKCTGLVKLDLSGNPALTEAKIAALQTALTKECIITHDGSAAPDTK
jgi:hypothetical protein